MKRQFQKLFSRRAAEAGRLYRAHWNQEYLHQERVYLDRIALGRPA